MEARRSQIILAVATALLAGCGQDTRQLEVENAQLKQMMTKFKGRELAEMDFYEHQAGLAEGCDVFFKVCPARLIEVGRQAVDTGYRGGLSWPFWVGFLGKIGILAAAAAGFLITLSWSWLRWIQPLAATVENERKLLDESKKKLAVAEKRLADLRATAAEREKKNDELLQVMKFRGDRVLELSKMIADGERKLEMTKEARTALASFD